MERKRKVGILGGTFNPIHYGHLVLAQTAFHDFKLDTVLIMPAKSPYYKNMTSSITTLDRVSMVSMAIDTNDKFELSMIEFDRDGATYTVDTLEELTKTNPNDEYYFIMGADSLFHFETWRNPARILELAIILAASRDNFSSSAINSQIAYLRDKYDGARIHHLNSPSFEISSHDIRNRIRKGNTIRYFLPEAVEDYITKNKLYLSK